jgi:hypothetical protein
MLILRGLNGPQPKKFEFSSLPTILAFFQTLNQHFDLIFQKHNLVQMFYENNFLKNFIFNFFSEKIVFVSL